MSHGNDLEGVKHNRVSLKWQDCPDCKQIEDYMCGACYLEYLTECQQND